MRKLISENVIKEILQTLHRQFGDKEFNTYRAQEYVKGDYDQLLNRLRYMDRVGFLDTGMKNGSRIFKITDKGYNLIHTKPREEVEMEVESVKKERTTFEKIRDKQLYPKKTPLQTIREERIRGILKDGDEYDKKEITKKLNKYEKVTHDLVYQMLRPMVEDGTVKVRQFKRTNYYSLPGQTVNVDEVETLEMKDRLREAPIDHVIIHEPTEILNTPEDPETMKPEYPKDNGVTIGHIMDLLWSKCTSAECRKPSRLKNHNMEAVMARFKDQQTLLEVFNQLPEHIRQDTKITIERKHKKVQLLIPIGS